MPAQALLCYAQSKFTQLLVQEVRSMGISFILCSGHFCRGELDGFTSFSQG